MEASRFLPPQSCACGPEGVRPEAFCKYVLGLDPSETMAVQNEKPEPSSSGPEGSVSAPGWPLPAECTTANFCAKNPKFFALAAGRFLK